MDWEITGGVEAVDREKGVITVWLNGFRELMVTPITPNMPKWVLQPNTGFRTTIPRICARNKSLEGVVWGKFEPIEWEYMTEQELVESLTEFFYPPENEADKKYKEEDWPPFLDWLGHA